MSWQGIIQQYKSYFSVSDKTPVVTLYEGNTHLYHARALSAEIQKNLKIFIKFEGGNPTGSFKDRGMTMAVSKAVEKGARAIMCASTGNTSASAAAYAARAGIKAYVLLPNNSIALGKLAQAAIHGAKIIALEGNFDDALENVIRITGETSIELVNSVNPYRIEGQKSGAYEICDVLGDAPDYHAIPVGNAGNISAYFAGYKDYYAQRKISIIPKMIGFQAAGAAPMVLGKPVKDPKTIATAIKIGNPASWEKAENAKTQSGGRIDAVTDDEILEAYKMVASLEGVFCEPASAASIAGVIKLSKEGYFSREKELKVVCVLTGHGLKDPDCAISVCEKPVVVPPTFSAIMDVLDFK